MIDVFKVGGTFIARVRKKFLKRKFQSVFEFVNKVVLARSEKVTVASDVDIFVIEYLNKFDLISFPALMIEYMFKVVHNKEERHGILYGYFLNKVFDHFGIIGEKETPGTAK